MKRTIIALLVMSIAFGCSDGKKQEKALLDSVIQMHDKMMGKDEQLMKNKMKLDTLLKAKTTSATDTLMGLSIEVTNAEDAMEKWMQKFDPEMKGKSHEDKMNYLSDQKSQVMAIDSMMSDAIRQSGSYIMQLKK